MQAATSHEKREAWPGAGPGLKTRAVVTALLRAVAALSLPPLRRVVALGLGLSVMTLALLWAAVGAILYRHCPFYVASA